PVQGTDNDSRPRECLGSRVSSEFPAHRRRFWLLTRAAKHTKITPRSAEHQPANGAVQFCGQVERHLEIRQSCPEAHHLSRPVEKRVPSLHVWRWSRGRDLPRRVSLRLRSQNCGFGRQPGARRVAAATTSASAETLP